jgi:ADP-ribose pyrophosphatase YjhB (NUDIX family)
MANQELLNKTYTIPSDVLNYIRTTLISNPNGEGVKRAKFMLNNGAVTYQVLKRLKNFFDYFNPQSGDRVQYALAGGDLMKAFIDKTLAADRNAVSTGKKVRQDMNVDVNQGLKPFQTPRLTEAKKKEKVKNEKFNIKDYDKLTKNALAIIVNQDNKILLLKRSDFKEQWMPSKWGLVGGGIKKNEEPEIACSREVKEETKLDIDPKEFIERVVVQRNPDSVEHLFACRYKGDDTDISLNEENSNYGWYDVGEMNYLDTVPNLVDYINLVFKKYD